MLEVLSLQKTFGVHRVIEDVSLSVHQGDRRVILGPNGAGKTTLFQLLSGNLAPDSGTITLDGVDITKTSIERRAHLGIGRSFQTNNLFDPLTVLENLTLAIAGKQKNPLNFWRNDFDSVSVRTEAEALAERLGLVDMLKLEVRNLPYGNRRQLEIALAVAQKPKLLLLDEPTSGVGPEQVETFHELLTNLPQEIAVVVIEHDLDLAFAIAKTMTVLHLGAVMFTGSPAEARNHPTVKDIYLGDWQA